MPNHKSAQKRHIQSCKKRLRNRMIKSALKTQLKKTNYHIQNKSNDAKKSITLAIKTISRAKTKGIIHKKNAAKKISKLMKKANNSDKS